MTNPSSSPFQTIAVLGSGTMGAGIAQIIAQKGLTVWLYDLEERFLSAAQERIQQAVADGVARGKVSEAEQAAVSQGLQTTTDLAQAVSQADLVIEAVPEDLALKRELFARLDAETPAEAILASNTSSLSITALGGATHRPQQVAGLHFFNPVPQMKLVEVVQGQQTAAETVARLRAFATWLGKVPVTAQDTPGFIVNRVARPFYGEALRLLAEQHPHETIDAIIKDAGGFRMGPFELMDLIGLDVNLAVTQSVYDATFQEPRYRPHPIQARMVAAGRLGRKTKAGFYTYE
jgi:3-hydroxybutyryl-CoA dehydrogenase